MLAAAALLCAWIVRALNTPSRVYDREANSVGREYDAWTSEGILEYYWGEHIHLGYYGEAERNKNRMTNVAVFFGAYAAFKYVVDHDLL